MEPPIFSSLDDMRDATERISANAASLAEAVAGIRREWDDETLGASIAFAQADGWRVGLMNSDGDLDPFDSDLSGDCTGVCQHAFKGGALDGTVTLGSGIMVQCRGVALGGSGSVLCGERMALPVFQSSDMADGPEVGPDAL